MGFWRLFQLSLGKGRWNRWQPRKTSNRCSQAHTNNQSTVHTLSPVGGRRRARRRKAPGSGSKPQPSCCQADVQTVAAPSRPGPPPSLQVSIPLFLFSLLPFTTTSPTPPFTTQHLSSLSLSSPPLLSVLLSPRLSSRYHEVHLLLLFHKFFLFPVWSKLLWSFTLRRPLLASAPIQPTHPTSWARTPLSV